MRDLVETYKGMIESDDKPRVYHRSSSKSYGKRTDGYIGTLDDVSKLQETVADIRKIIDDYKEEFGRNFNVDPKIEFKGLSFNLRKRARAGENKAEYQDSMKRDIKPEVAERFDLYLLIQRDWSKDKKMSDKDLRQHKINIIQKIHRVFKTRAYG